MLKTTPFNILILTKNDSKKDFLHSFFGLFKGNRHLLITFFLLFEPHFFKQMPHHDGCTT